MFTGYGKLHYRNNWLIIGVDESICHYYRKLISYQNRSLRFNRPKYPAHVTVIAGKHEIIKDKYKDLWNKYQDEIVEFLYDSEIVIDRQYFWLRVECKRIEDIREELGLTRKIPVPWHLTIANTK